MLLLREAIESGEGRSVGGWEIALSIWGKRITALSLEKWKVFGCMRSALYEEKCFRVGLGR